MRKSAGAVASIFIVLFLFTACHSTEHNKEAHTVLYTTIYPIQYITEQLTSDFAEVISVYPPGVDAHSYEPTTREMLEIARGEAFIYLGAGMEAFADSAKTALQTSEVEFIEVGEHDDVFIEDSHEHEGHDHIDVDPHIWFDPIRMIDISEIIKNELIEIFPDHSKTVTKNYVQLEEKLMTLDEEFINTLTNKTNKHIIVSHAAYGYWEERYGIKQISVSGLTAGDEPSQKDLASIVQQASEHDIGYILFEQNASNRIATIVQEHLDAQPLYIHNLEVLVDEDIENNEDYFSLMRENLQILDQATN